MAPMIGSLIILIACLLLIAHFLTENMTEVSVSVSKEIAPRLPSDEKPMFLTMDLTASGSVLLKVSGGNLQQDYDLNLPPKADGTLDSIQLAASLARMKSQWKKLNDVSISAAPTVQYKDLVNLINETQKSLPKVYVSGG